MSRIKRLLKVKRKSRVKVNQLLLNQRRRIRRKPRKERRSQVRKLKNLKSL